MTSFDRYAVQLDQPGALPVLCRRAFTKFPSIRTLRQTSNRVLTSLFSPWASRPGWLATLPSHGRLPAIGLANSISDVGASRSGDTPYSRVNPGLSVPCTGGSGFFWQGTRHSPLMERVSAKKGAGLRGTYGVLRY